GILPLEVGVVKTFDMTGKHVHAEVALHLGKDTLGLQFGIELLILVEPLLLKVQGILERKLQQFPLFALLRHNKPEFFGIDIQRKRNDNFFGRTIESATYLGYRQT